MGAWVTSVTGTWSGDRGGQLLTAPWGEKQSLERDSQRPPRTAGLSRQEPWLGPSSASRVDPCSVPCSEQAEGPQP